MGIGGISIWQLLIILVIVLLLFGTKRLRGLGGDLGGAIKGFKKAVKEDSAEEDKKDQTNAVESEERQQAAESADAQQQKSETKQ